MKASLDAVAEVVSLRGLQVSNSSLAPLRVNRFARAAEKRVEQFAQRFGLVLPTLSGFNTMSAFLFPDASLERLVAIGEYNLLLFFIDDVHGDSAENQGLLDKPVSEYTRRMIENAMQAFGTRALGDMDPVVQAFYQVRKQMEPLTNTSWLDRCHQSTYDHLMSSMNPRGYGWTPDLSVQQYIYFREYLSGMYPTMDLIEFALNTYLPDELLLHPVMSRLRQSCARIGGLTNDLFSYEKEVLTGGQPLNLLAVIQNTRSCSLREAVAEASDIINFETQEFVAKAAVAKRWSEPVRRYVEGLEYQIAATWNWQIRTERYRSPQSPFIELRVRFS